MLIVIEGLDRAGKSSLSRNLCARLQSFQVNLKVNAYHSPQPDTATYSAIQRLVHEGACIDKMPHVFHMLFAASRFEIQPNLENQLKAKEIVIYDRYAYSGKVYADIDKCGFDESISHGLLTPDVVFFIDVDPHVSTMREGFGTGLFEKAERQHAAAAGFRSMFSKPSIHCCNSICTLNGTSDSVDVVADSAFLHLQQSGLLLRCMEDTRPALEYGIFKKD
jgi:dTMP kinase